MVLRRTDPDFKWPTDRPSELVCPECGTPDIGYTLGRIKGLFDTRYRCFNQKCTRSFKGDELSIWEFWMIKVCDEE